MTHWIIIVKGWEWYPAFEATATEIQGWTRKGWTVYQYDTREDAQAFANYLG